MVPRFLVELHRGQVWELRSPWRQEFLKLERSIGGNTSTAIVKCYCEKGSVRDELCDPGASYRDINWISITDGSQHLSQKHVT